MVVQGLRRHSSLIVTDLRHIIYRGAPDAFAGIPGGVPGTAGSRSVRTIRYLPGWKPDNPVLAGVSLALTAHAPYMRIKWSS